MLSILERDIQGKIGEKVKNMKNDFLIEIFQIQLVPHHSNVAFSAINIAKTCVKGKGTMLLVQFFPSFWTNKKA